MTCRLSFITKVTNYKRNRIFEKCARCVSTAVLDLEDMPAPRGLPLLGTTLALMAAGSTPKLHKYIDMRHKQLGPVFRDAIGPVSAVFVSDPEEMRAVFMQEGKYPLHVLPEAWIVYNEIYNKSRGLFFMNGPEWLQFRKIMNKLLLKGDQAWITEACEVVSEKTIKRIETISSKHEIFPNLENELYRWSLEVLVSILLGADSYITSKNLDSLIDELASTIYTVFNTTAKLSLIPAKLAAKLRIPRWNKFVKSVDDALKISNDLVMRLLEDYPESDGLLRKMLDENVSPADIVRIVADLVIAAGDTTAYSMEWILYLMAKNETEQERLFNVLNSTEKNSPLLKNIIREGLRLYPVAPFLSRFLPKDCIIAGYNVPQGTLIILSLYTSSRDPRNFRNPELFAPDRWLRSINNVTAMQQASIPFALGARSCIGRKIAETQLQLTLADIVKNFRIQARNDKQVEMILKMVAVPEEPIRLTFIKR